MPGLAALGPWVSARYPTSEPTDKIPLDGRQVRREDRLSLLISVEMVDQRRVCHRRVHPTCPFVLIEREDVGCGERIRIFCFNQQHCPRSGSRRQCAPWRPPCSFRRGSRETSNRSGAVIRTSGPGTPTTPAKAPRSVVELGSCLQSPCTTINPIRSDYTVSIVSTVSTVSIVSTIVSIQYSIIFVAHHMKSANM